MWSLMRANAHHFDIAVGDSVLVSNFLILYSLYSTDGGILLCILRFLHIRLLFRKLMFYFLEGDNNMKESKCTCVCMYMPMRILPPPPLLLNTVSVFTNFVWKLCKWIPIKLIIINFIRYNVPDAQTCYMGTTVTILQSCVFVNVWEVDVPFGI